MLPVISLESAKLVKGRPGDSRYGSGLRKRARSLGNVRREAIILLKRKAIIRSSSFSCLLRRVKLNEDVTWRRSEQTSA